MKLTAICLAYNHESTIEDTLRGFVHQLTDFDFEVLVGDDASLDRTPEIIQDYASKYPHILKPFLREKNLGVYKNAADLWMRVKSEYTAICEGDDYWCHDHFLQKAVTFLDKNPDYNLFSGNTINNYQEQGRQNFNIPIHDKVNASGEFSLSHHYHTHVSARICRYLRHFPFDDTVELHYLMSLGKTYYHNEVFSVRNYTGLGVWSALSSEEQNQSAAAIWFGLNKFFNFDHEHDKNYTECIGLSKFHKSIFKRVKKLIGPEKTWEHYYKWKKYPTDYSIRWIDEENIQ